MFNRLWLAVPALALGFIGLLAPVRAATPADTIVMARAIDDLETPDPAEGYNQTEGEVIANCYDRLLRYEPEDLTKLVGEGVESWTVSDDGKTFTLKLRPGQKFHSGNPVRAEDIAFSLQRVVILNKTPALLLTQLGWNANNVRQLVKVVDSESVSATIVNDYAPSLVLNLFSASVASMVDEKEVMQHEVNGDLGNAWLKTHDAGSGPYVLRSWKPNDSVIFEADPDYRLGAPAIKRVILKQAADSSAQRLLLEKGDVDIARGLGPDDVAGLSGNPDIVVTRMPSAEMWYLGLNVKDERLANPKVREAIRYLIDYQGMAASFLKGQVIVHQSFLPKGFVGAVDDTPYSLDVAKAKQLLAEAGYPNGFQVEINAFNFSPFAEIAQSIQQTMAEAGIKLDIVQGDHTLISSIYKKRQHQIITQRWNSDYADPHSNAVWFAYNADNSDHPKSKPLTWRNSWYSPEISKETDAAREEKDADKRAQLYRDLQEKVRAEGPFVFLFQINRVYAARQGVKGFVMGATYDAIFYRLMSK
jgi:peptide/nickel transport system substrate-binding protein